MSPVKLDWLDLPASKNISGSRVVFPAVCLLAIASITSAVVALVVYGSQALTVDLWICQALVICSSSGTFVFLALYLLAARRNEPIGVARPPARPIHAGSFIALRVTVICWIAAAIGSLVVALKMPKCYGSNKACQLQQISAVISWSALLDSLVLMLVLGRCEKPFETPAVLRIRPRDPLAPLCDDDILERSVSRASTYNDEKFRELEKIEEEEDYPENPEETSGSIKRKPLSPDSPILQSGFQQPEAPLNFLPMPQKLSIISLRALSQGFKFDKRLSTCTNLIEETGCTKQCCSPAMSESIPSEYTLSSKQSSAPSSLNETISSKQSSQSSSYSFLNEIKSTASSKSEMSSWNSNATTLTRAKSGYSTPSSSASSTRRSPLSTMRTADQPDLAIHPEFQNFQNFQNSGLPPPQQWADPRYYKMGAILPHRPASRGSSAHSSSMVSPVSMRKASLQQNAAKQHGVPRPLTPRSASSSPRKRPGDMRLAGTHPGYEDAIDAHTRKIEESIAARVKDIERREARLREQTSMRMVPPTPKPSSPWPQSPRVTKSHAAHRSPDLRYGEHRMRTSPRPTYHPFPQNRSPRARPQQQHQQRSPRQKSPPQQHPRSQPQQSPRQWPFSPNADLDVVEPLRVVKRKTPSPAPLSPIAQQSPYPIIGGKPSPPPQQQAHVPEPRPGSVTPRTAAAEPSYQYNWPIPAVARVKDTDFDSKKEVAQSISKIMQEERIPEQSPVLPDIVLDRGRLWDF